MPVGNRLCLPGISQFAEAAFLNRLLSIETDCLRLYSACVLLVLLCGLEKWMLLQCDLHKLEQFHHQCLILIVRVSCKAHWELHISNTALRQQWVESATWYY